jgi:cytochrome P450
MTGTTSTGAEMETSTRFDGDLSFLHPATNSNPFPAYSHLLRECPVYFDPAIRFFVVSRYEDIRRILMDPKTFSSAAWQDTAREHFENEQSKQMAQRFALKGGWIPSPNVASMDDPRHREVRALFEKAFRPGRVKDMEGNIRHTATSLVEAIASKGRSEVVTEFSIPFPMTVIFSEVGARLQDIWRIKGWMNTLVERVSFFQTPEQQINSIDHIVEAQHYFKKVVDDLRGNSNGTVLSDLVNTPLSDGQFMSDRELVTNIMEVIFLAGTETTTNAITAGVRILCEQPALFDSLRASPVERMRVFVEEVLRLESPAQGIYRVVTEEVELHGIKLAPGSVLHLRVGAANRDEDKFSCPAHVDLNRKNAAVHLAFGSGLHHCVGSILARRELYWAFATIVDRFKTLRFSDQQGPIEYLQNYMFRSIKALHVQFEAA